jgi:hypothetical protein
LDHAVKGIIPAGGSVTPIGPQSRETVEIKEPEADSRIRPPTPARRAYIPMRDATKNAKAFDPEIGSWEKGLKAIIDKHRK